MSSIDNSDGPGFAGLKSALADRYAIEREVGSGGSATVFLAHDLKHGRQVALKVLRPELSAILGPERFLSEVRVTANLQHPHILPLFDSGVASGLLYYVMPFVAGESLRQKRQRERQLAVDDAIRITTQVAAALDYAHRHGIIHRDIKPENTLLHDGQAVVADFGIALALRNAGGSRLTQTGIALGTPEYMSPEQATGARELDARSDIYVLGCVLFEMLAGEPPHTGPTVQAVIAKVLTEEPRSILSLRKTVPVHVAAALERALARLPADRWPSAADFAAALEGRLSPALTTQGRGAPDKTQTGQRAWQGSVLWFLSVVATATAMALAYVALTTDRRGGGPASWWFALPDSAPVFFECAATSDVGPKALDLSPDGTRLVYVARQGATTTLYVHSIGTFDVRKLPGTEGAFLPFFSPDGRWIAFFAGSHLKKIAADGGPVFVLADVTVPIAGDWVDDERIAVVDNEAAELRLFPAGGGPALKRFPAPFVRSIDVLPGGRSALIQRGFRPGAVAVISLESGASRWLDRSGAPPDTGRKGERLYGRPHLLESGHLLLASETDNALLAVRFDPRSLRVNGPAVPVLTGVRSATAGAQYAMVANGLLAFAPGRNAAVGRLVWANERGELDTLPLPEAVYGQPDISPDSTLLAVPVLTSDGWDELRIYDLADLPRGPQHRWRPSSRFNETALDAGFVGRTQRRPSCGPVAFAARQPDRYARSEFLCRGRHT